MEDRLHKVMAHAGVGSRRTCETYIAEGRVRVDGKVVTQMGTKVDPEVRKITFDGRPIHVRRNVYYLVNKPKGTVCTNDERSPEPRVIDLVPQQKERLFTVGRLDKDTVGLIIVTNDGDLSNFLTHPRYGIRKAYVAAVDGYIQPEDLEKLEQGVYLSDGRTLPAQVKLINRGPQASTVRIEVKEGRNRLIRRMLAKLGYKVRSLRRIAIGPITMRGLKVGNTRLLNKNEVALLYKIAKEAPKR